MTRLVGAALLLLLFLAPKIGAAKDTIDVGSAPVEEEGPKLNPFECYGRYESATGNRTAHQIGIELKKKVDQLDDGEPNTVRAMKACVIARLKARLGHGDAAKWFKESILLDPEEPGYELFFGMYYGGMRGSHTPAAQEAELHLVRALRKLSTLEQEKKLKEYHETVRSFTEKQLMVLYQQDGQQIFPFKGHSPGPTLLQVPSLSVLGEGLISRDTRDFWYNNEMRVFSGEKQFAQSTIRANRALSERETWDIARTPLRTRAMGGLRLRQNVLGVFDATYTHEFSPESQIVSFYNPTEEFSDVTVNSLKLGYQRVFPLYPVLDLRVAGEYMYIERQGILEFEPEVVEKFHGFALRPSVSRFIGPDKITLEGTVVYFDIQDLPGEVPDQGLREKLIRSAKLTYSLYRPLRTPHDRVPTRGLSFYAGLAQDFETYGIRRVKREDLYGGVTFRAPTFWDANLQGTQLKARTTFIDQNDPAAPEYSDRSQDFNGMRASGSFTVRVVDQEARPLVGSGALDLDMLNVVFPVQWDKSLQSESDLSPVDDYENVRVGAGIWAKVFGPKTGGTPLLFNAGYDFQAFYNMDKFVHVFQTGLRLGWGDL